MTKLSNTALAVDRLRHLVFTGALAAGSDHLEGELAAQLGLSRTPVREALLVLESQGLVEVRPRKGVRITPVSPKDMAEIYDVLTELESLAARRAAEAGYDDAALDVLAETIDAMDRALREDDRHAWAKADDQFHTELVRLGQNARIEAIVQLMADQVRRARLVTLYMRPAPVQSNEDHRRVLRAIASGAPDKAATLHRAHREAAKATLISLLETHHLNHL